jgi:hypothetical protein
LFPCVLYVLAISSSLTYYLNIFFLWFQGMIVQSVVVWAPTQFLLGGYRYFGGICCLHLQGYYYWYCAINTFYLGNVFPCEGKHLLQCKIKYSRLYFADSVTNILFDIC